MRQSVAGEGASLLLLFLRHSTVTCGSLLLLLLPCLSFPLFTSFSLAEASAVMTASAHTRRSPSVAADTVTKARTEKSPAFIGRSDKCRQ